LYGQASPDANIVINAWGGWDLDLGLLGIVWPPQKQWRQQHPVTFGPGPRQQKRK